MLSGPILAIRADATREGGAGHVMRTLALAQKWISRGGRCIYLSYHLPALLKDRLEHGGCEIEMLLKDDASTLSTVVTGLSARWLLIDHYQLGQVFQQELRLPKKARLAVVSDHGVKDFHAPDIVIHANLSTTADYSTATSTSTILSGPDYILLRQELLSTDTPLPVEEAKNILITMGGSDPREAGFFIATALLEEGFLNERNCRVLLGPSYSTEGLAHSLAHPHIELVQSPSSMAEQYQWADIAICSPSVTSLELAHTGVPMAVCLTADNQIQVAEALASESAATLAGDFRTEAHLQMDVLKNLLDDLETRRALALKSQTLVDGKGSARICDRMGLPAIKLRSAQAKDAKQLWKWTNDPTTRQASFQSAPIPWDEHLAWFNASMENATRLMIIAENDEGIPIAQVRFDQVAELLFTISISLSPSLRGLGLAPLIIEKSGNHLRGNSHETTIEAWIKSENMASIRSFERAGYEHDPDGTLRGSDHTRVRMLSLPLS